VRTAELEIKHFHGTGRIPFGTLTLLIGANNSGKTTIVEVLAWLLGPRTIDLKSIEQDFHGSKPEMSRPHRHDRNSYRF